MMSEPPFLPPSVSWPARWWIGRGGPALCCTTSRRRFDSRWFASSLSLRLRDDRLVGDLTALLKTESDAVERQAIDTLRSLGPPGIAALDVVIGKLNKGHPEDVRVAAVLMIESQGRAATRAVSALAALLDDPNPKLLATAVRALASMGKAAQPALGRLSPLLKTQQAEIREAAVMAIGSLELDAETVRPHLASALRDEKSEVRRAATRAIQRFGPQGAIFLPDIILLAEKKENLRSVERMLRRFRRPPPRSAIAPRSRQATRQQARFCTSPGDQVCAGRPECAGSDPGA